MKGARIFSSAMMLLAAAVLAVMLRPAPAEAGIPGGGYQVLAPIQHGNLTIFPVVGGSSHDTGDFITLDDGLRSGEVVVTENGGVTPLVRGGGRGCPPNAICMQAPPQRGPEVNRLYLENNSKHPLILLAGEVVTGGKQDRIVGKDLIVPAESESDLSVFCIEPGRWTGRSAKFGGAGGYGGGAYMVQPSVRAKAMGEKDQGQVWSEVSKAREAVVSGAAGLPAPAAAAVGQSSSYARMMENKEVQAQVDSVAAPVERSYAQVIRELRDRGAVGVVAAVNGQIVWADVFASTALLEKYWPKLARSYAMEAVVNAADGRAPSINQAQEFLDQVQGRHQTADSEPGVYQYSEIDGDGFKAFRLTSLLPGANFDVHLSKMAED